MTVKDRRVRRTKQFLEDGLLQLLQEKSIKNITVRELTERVDINRSTFYLHYMDIFDMVEKIEQQLIDDFYDEWESNRCRECTLQEEVYQFMEISLSYIKKHRQKVLILCSKNGDRTFIERLAEVNFKQARVWIRSLLGEQAEERQVDLATTFFCNGCVAVENKWLVDDEMQDPEEILKLMFQLVLNGAKGFVTKENEL